MTIAEKLSEIYRLAQEIKNDAAVAAASAPDAPTRRYFQSVMLQESGIDKIGFDFERCVLPRAVHFCSKLEGK